jgi:hypothetical protein
MSFAAIYRMSRCRKCPRHCKPCLTLEEAEIILNDETSRSYLGNTICDACHQKSNDSQNKRTYEKAGREWGDQNMTELEKLQRELEKLEKELAKLKGKK